MSPVATVLLHSVRYSHARSLHPHEDTIAAVRELWPLLSERDRAEWLRIVEEQVPRELWRRIDAHGGGCVPVTRAELEGELAAYVALFDWCRARLGPVAEWPCDACGCARGPSGGACRCRCHPDRLREIDMELVVELDMPVRAKNILRNAVWARTVPAGERNHPEPTVRDVVRLLTWRDIRAVRGCGARTQWDIRQWARANGVAIREEP